MTSVSAGHILTSLTVLATFMATVTLKTHRFLSNPYWKVNFKGMKTLTNCSLFTQKSLTVLATFLATVTLSLMSTLETFSSLRGKTFRQQDLNKTSLYLSRYFQSIKKLLYGVDIKRIYIDIKKYTVQFIKVRKRKELFKQIKWFKSKDRMAEDIGSG